MQFSGLLSILLLSIATITKASFVIRPKQYEAVNDAVIGSLPLNSNDQNQLIGNISIGYPPQNISVLFNISASNLIVYGNNFQLNPSISTASGPQNGFLATSSVSIAGLNITAQQFILTLGSSPYANVGGVFGLGYTAADINNSSSPLYNLVAQNLITQKLFSIRLQGMEPSNESGSELYLGGIDSSLQISQFIYPETSNATDWQFNVSTIYINGTLVSNNASTYLSTSSNAVAVPDAIFSTLQQYLGVAPNASGDYSVPCDTIEPIFTLQFNSSNLTLLASDFMSLPNDSQSSTSYAQLCVFNIENSGSDIWRLGTPFLAKYYTTFNISSSSIGFGVYYNESSSVNTTTTSPITTPGRPETTTYHGNAAGELFTGLMYQKILCIFVILLFLK